MSTMVMVIEVRRKKIDSWTNFLGRCSFIHCEERQKEDGMYNQLHNHDVFLDYYIQLTIVPPDAQSSRRLSVKIAMKNI